MTSTCCTCSVHESGLAACSPATTSVLCTIPGQSLQHINTRQLDCVRYATLDDRCKTNAGQLEMCAIPRQSKCKRQTTGCCVLYHASQNANARQLDVVCYTTPVAAKHKPQTTRCCSLHHVIWSLHNKNVKRLDVVRYTRLYNRRKTQTPDNWMLCAIPGQSLQNKNAR